MFSEMVQARSSVLYCGTTPIALRANAGTGDANASRGGQGARGADADGGGFASTVGSEQPVDGALFNGQVDAIDRDYLLLALVDLTQAPHFNNHAASALFRHGSL